MASKQDENDAPARTSAPLPQAGRGPAAPLPDAPDGSAEPAFERVLEMVRFLRVHCPWDREQTPRSLLPYLLEEAHEVAHHVEDGDDDALAGELGDLLLHVAFQAALARERGAFEPTEPARRVLDKMRRRHPHLFGLGEARDWEEMKAAERESAAGRESAERESAANDDGTSAADDDTAADFSHLDNLAKGLDPLALAHRIQDRVSSVGFDWDDASGAFAKVREEVEELAELGSNEATARDGTPGNANRDATPGGANRDARARLEEEIGDLLFAVVNFARLSGIHADLALRAANAKFERRFRALERLARARDVRLGAATLEELDRLWDEVKAGERER